MKKGRRFAHRHKGPVLFISIGILLASCIPLMIAASGAEGTDILPPVIFTAAFVFCIWLFIVHRGYVLKEDHLLVITGPIRRRYFYSGITRVRYIRQTALRCAGFRLYYMGEVTALVNPKEVQEFADALRDKCPDAVFEIL